MDALRGIPGVTVVYVEGKTKLEPLVAQFWDNTSTPPPTRPSTARRSQEDTLNTPANRSYAGLAHSLVLYVWQRLSPTGGDVVTIEAICAALVRWHTAHDLAQSTVGRYVLRPPSVRTQNLTREPPRSVVVPARDPPLRAEQAAV
jgi:hypothetical protein